MEQTWECGDKGDNVTAILSEDGATLTIRGTGRMKNYKKNLIQYHGKVQQLLM
jgi:hypothetical protein